MADPGTTEALAESVCEIAWEDIPEEVREVARHCLLDCLGTTLAGSREPLVEVLVGTLVRGEEAGEATLVGRPERASRPTAALVNGAAGHALDFDDTHLAMTGHPTVPVLPALLALAERGGGDGRRFLAALVAGIELECRLGLLLGARPYEVGFHSTATLGAFGAAAACAHWLGLEPRRWLRALGLAGIQAAGLKCAFGSMGKPFQVGRAAQSGLLAAMLAAEGFDAPEDILEASQGFAATHAASDIDGSRLAEAKGRWLVRETLFKFHAACYLTHAAIEAARCLREAESIDPEAIDRVEVVVHPSLLSVCGIAEPKTGLEGKFSLRATVALALRGADTAALDTFSDATMRDPGLVRLRDRVRISTDPSFSLAQARVVVDVGKRRLEAQADTGQPEPDLARQRERLLRKFESLATPVLGAQGAASLAEAALAREPLDPRRLLSRARR
jgi:2-methylcitrate dehydratase PrpD